MRRIVISILFGWMGLVLPALAQEITLSLKVDSTFNAAEIKEKTFKGFDVDTSQVNVVNIGMQLSLDVVDSKANDPGITSSLTNSSYFRQRLDMVFSSALPEHTNVYATLSFINPEGDANVGKIFFTNMEVEHYFMNHTKIRIGRLVNQVSESQFFGRIALEESSAHYYGRTVYINDAIEFDGNLRHKGGPVFFIGMKPRFKPFNLKGVYAGFHQPFKNGLQTHAIVSLNRQFESDMQKYIPTFEGKDVYGAYEAEVAYKKPTATVYLNVGGNIGYQGLLPHVSGSMDFMQQLKPVITRKGDSFKETFMGSVGLHLHPSKMSPGWKFLPLVCLEAELQGALTNRFTTLNIFGICRFSLTRRVVLTYNCTPQFIWQKFNPSKPNYMGGVVNFLRLSVVVGKVGRLYM